MKQNLLLTVFSMMALGSLAEAQVANYVVGANTGGGIPNGGCSGVHVSESGRFYVFDSDATDLVTSPVISSRDIFRHDVETGTTELVSVSPSGTDSANDFCYDTNCSSDGRYVVWRTRATNLTPTPPATPGMHGYLRDMQTGVTTQVDQLPGVAIPGELIRLYISADAKYILIRTEGAFDPADDNGWDDLYRYEVATGVLVPVSVTSAGVFGASGVRFSSFSDDGRFAVFTSQSSDLSDPPLPNGAWVFLKDMQTGELTHVSQGLQAPTQSFYNTAPAISGDGSTIAFMSFDSSLAPGDTNDDIDIIVRDRVSGAMEIASLSTSGSQVTSISWFTPLDLNSDGRFLAFDSRVAGFVPNDTNFSSDVFIRDRVAETTTRVGLQYDGGQLGRGAHSASISGDGRRIAFATSAKQVIEDFGTTFIPDPVPYARDLESLGLVGSNYCQGAPNSTGWIAVIGADGSSVVADNQITLTASRLPEQSFGFFLTSLTSGFTPGPGGSAGVLCLGDAIGRFVGPGQVLNSGPDGRTSLVLDLLTLPSPTGNVSAISGETRYFQAWTRDTVLGTPTSNFTNAVAVELR